MVLFGSVSGFTTLVAPLLPDFIRLLLLLLFVEVVMVTVRLLLPLCFCCAPPPDPSRLLPASGMREFCSSIWLGSCTSRALAGMLALVGVIVVAPVPMGEFSDIDATDSRSAGSKLTPEEDEVVEATLEDDPPDGLAATAGCSERLVAIEVTAVAADVADDAAVVDCVMLCCCWINFSLRSMHIRL